MTYLSVLGLIVSILLVGAAALALVRTPFERARWLEHLPLLFATGSVIVANWGLARVVTGWRFHPMWVLGPALAIVLWNGRSSIRGWRPSIPNVSLPTIHRPTGGVFLALVLGGYAALRVGASLVASLNADMGWDGLFYWGLKAKLILDPELGYFSDVWLKYTHPDYPLLLPSIEAWSYAWGGGVDLRVVKWIVPLAIVISGILVYTGLRHFHGPGSSALFAVASLLPVPVSGYSVSSYADPLLAAFFTGMMVYGCLYVRKPHSGFLLSMALFAAAAFLTKKEGMILSLVLLGAIGVWWMVKGRGLHVEGWLVALGVGAVVSLPWLFFSVAIRPSSYDFAPITASSLLLAVSRVPEIAIRFFGELTTWEKWGITWAAVPVAVLLFPRRLRRPEVAFCLAMLLIPLALYAATYGFSIWPTATAHMNSSLERLLLHLVPAALFAAGVVSAPDAPKSAL